MSRRAARTPVVDASPIVSIRAACYCGASSVPLAVRASHAEERAAIAQAVAACAVCGRGSRLAGSVTNVDQAPVVTVITCPTCGRQL